MKSYILVTLIACATQCLGQIHISPLKDFYTPLEEVTIEHSEGFFFEIFDGNHRKYHSGALAGPAVFVVGGALGTHRIAIYDKNGTLLTESTILVDGKTTLRESTGVYQELMDILYWTMHTWSGDKNMVRVDGEYYRFFVRWLRDHVHALKGMKYFAPELQSGIDLYADHQRYDGMIWDNVYMRYFQKNWWEKRFAYGGFYEEIAPGDFEFKRIPVENDVEYLFIEGIYYTWKATAADHWMESLLDKALLALDYATTDEYRWSEKYQLLKRGFTIDTWDFQPTEDAEISGNDIMVVFPDKTRFGVMFGDNTGMFAACNYLSEMLIFAGRHDEARRVQELGEDLLERTNELAWNGDYYRHHVPEDATIQRDLGVNQELQVSLSNAYSINRGIGHEKVKSIIATYQGIRQEMPTSSPGEWYTIYPPFGKGFGRWDSTEPWDYMNGGVSPIVAGELAHGAFEHGYEAYGADILRRLRSLAAKTNNYLHCTYRGQMPEPPNRIFQPVDLSSYTNAVYPPPKATFDGSSFYDGANGGQKVFHGVPFQLAEPSSGASGIVFSQQGLRDVTIPVDRQASSLYFLHNRENGQVAGTITIEYDDQTTYTEFMTNDKVGFWWSEGLENGHCKQAWRSNDMSHFVGMYVYGMNNPHPNKTIKSLQLEGTDSVPTWRVSGITLSDHQVYFEPSIVSHGIPDNWGAAAVMYALVEGLVGVKDVGVSFDRAMISPRWSVTDVKEASAMIKYEASGGYASYRYQQTDDQLTVVFTGNANEFHVQVLLPENTTVRQANLNGEPISVQTLTIEKSTYAQLTSNKRGVNRLAIGLQKD